MPAIDQAMVAGFVQASAVAQTTTEKGRALEDLICYVFGAVPGIAITRRNQMNVFHTEEVDVAFFNDKAPDGLPFLPDLILVEAKNWSSNVGSAEVAWFDTKVRHRGLPFGVLVTTLGVTGNAQDLTAAHHTIAAALMEQRRLIVITIEELQGLTDTSELVTVIKTKLCDLALRGTIV
jgi:Restriction endonuclease